jgi:hypothetical protein
MHYSKPGHSLQTRKSATLTCDDHLYVGGGADEYVAEQVGEGHGVEGRPPPPQPGHGGDGEEAANHRTQHVHAA